MKYLSLVLISFVLSGCATPYQAHTWSGGYKDKKVGENHYLVEYYGNGTTSVTMLKEFWNRRATEVCPNGYDVLTQDKGATDGGIFLGGITSIEHPWLKAEIACR